MFETIKRGWALTKLSFRVIQQDKELLLFPVLSGIGLLMALLGFGGLAFWMQHTAGLSDAAALLFFLAYYFVSYFITIYFNTALVSAARIRLDGGDPTLKDGFRGSNSRISQILGWTLLAATVGLILQILQNLARDQRNPIAQIVGVLFTQLAGMAWSIVTYFVIPVFVMEKTGPIESVKRSAAIMRRTWGEALTGHVGIGVVFFLLGLLGLIPLFIGLNLLGTGMAAVGVGIVFLAFLYWITLVVLNSAASQVLVAALHRFATEGDTGGFMPNDSARAVFDPNARWDAHTDPSTGRIRGA